MQNLNKDKKEEKLIENNKNKNGKVKHGIGIIAKVDKLEAVRNDTSE